MGTESGGVDYRLCCSERFVKEVRILYLHEKMDNLVCNRGEDNGR